MIEAVAVGHDQHDGLAGLDHAAHRVHGTAGRPCRPAAPRRSMRFSWSSAATRFSTSSDFLPRISASSLPTSVRRSSSICRILSSVSAMRPRACADRGDQRAALALEPGAVALERRHAAERHQVLLPQVAHALQLLLDPVDLLGLGGLLLDIALDLLARAGRSARWSWAFWPSRAAAADLEQLLLARHHLGRPPDRRARASSSAGKLDLVGAVALGLVARLARRQLVERLGDDGEVGARLGLVEPHHDVARLDVVAFLDPELADHAAGRVLDLLDVGIDDELARRDHGAGDLGRRRPAADAADQQRRRRRRPASEMARRVDR